MFMKVFNVNESGMHQVENNVCLMVINRDNYRFELLPGDIISFQEGDTLTINKDNSVEQIKITNLPDDDCFGFRGLTLK